jgi:hypothetical protein
VVVLYLPPQLVAVALVQELFQQVQMMVLLAAVVRVAARVPHGRLEETALEPQGKVTQVAMVFLVTAAAAVVVRVLLVQVPLRRVMLAPAEQG